MPFTGLSANDAFTASLLQEDIGRMFATLAPIEAPFLDWLGDAPGFATSIKHEYVEDFVLPNYIVASTAINSATAATAVQVNGLGLALTVGTIVENESANPEIMQVTSIVGANSVVFSRAYGGGAVGSLVAGGSLYVREPAAIEGRDHSGANTQRLGNRLANTIGYLSADVAVSGTLMATPQVGNDSFEANRAKILRQLPSMLEKEVLRGVLNSTNSLGSSSQTRTMKGVRSFLSTVNSTVTATSFAANPHLYIGNVWESMWQNGASTSETWGIVAGRTFFRDISNLNDTKVQDTNARESFKRVIREYEGPFGIATVFPSRVLPATELLIVPRERVRVVPLNGRSFTYVPIATQGDNQKGMFVGEYTVEVHHESAMGRLRV